MASLHVSPSVFAPVVSWDAPHLAAVDAGFEYLGSGYVLLGSDQTFTSAEEAVPQDHRPNLRPHGDLSTHQVGRSADPGSGRGLNPGSIGHRDHPSLRHERSVTDPVSHGQGERAHHPRSRLMTKHDGS